MTMIFRPVAVLGLAALAVTSWSITRWTRQRRLAQRSPTQPEPIKTWEGEGGGLPDGGPGPGVNVTGTAETYTAPA